MNEKRFARLARRVARLEQMAAVRKAEDEGVEEVVEAEDSVEETTEASEDFTPDDVEVTEADEDGELDAVMADLELSSDDDDDDEDDEFDFDDDDDDDDDDEDDEDDEDRVDIESSLEDPDGLEEQITQDYLSEVQGLTDGTESLTHDSMLSVGKKAYVAKMRRVSARLDRVADFLEKSGRVELAGRVDRIADQVDSRVAKVVGR